MELKGKDVKLRIGSELWDIDRLWILIASQPAVIITEDIEYEDVTGQTDERKLLGDGKEIN